MSEGKFNVNINFDESLKKIVIETTKTPHEDTKCICYVVTTAPPSTTTLQRTKLKYFSRFGYRGREF